MVLFRFTHTTSSLILPQVMDLSFMIHLTLSISCTWQTDFPNYPQLIHAVFISMKFVVYFLWTSVIAIRSLVCLFSKEFPKTSEWPFDFHILCLPTKKVLIGMIFAMIMHNILHLCRRPFIVNLLISCCLFVYHSTYSFSWFFLSVLFSFASASLIYNMPTVFASSLQHSPPILVYQR